MHAHYQILTRSKKAKQTTVYEHMRFTRFDSNDTQLSITAT